MGSTVSYLHGLIRCLGVILGDQNEYLYDLYPYFFYFSVFAEFKFTSLNHKIRRCFLGPRRSKKIAKRGPK